MIHEKFEAQHCKDIIDLIPEPFVIINKHYQIVAANKQYRNKYEQAGSEIIGDTCYHISHHSDVPCHEKGEPGPTSVSRRSRLKFLRYVNAKMTFLHLQNIFYQRLMADLHIIPCLKKLLKNCSSTTTRAMSANYAIL